MIPTGQDPIPVPPPASSPQDFRSGTTIRTRSPRVTALIEVILCSGFPTQLMLAGVLLALGLSSMDAAGRLSLAYVVVLSLADAAVLLALIFYILHLHGESSHDVFFGTRPPRTEIRLGLLLAPLMVIVALVSLGVIQSYWPWLRNVPENPLEALIQSPLDAFVFTVVAVVAGGLREELQRAFVLRRFEQHLGGGWLGLVVFSVAFGLGHYIQGWDAAIVTASLGAVWGTIYLMRRSVVSAMVSHAGFNVAEILIALFAAAAV